MTFDFYQQETQKLAVYPKERGLEYVLFGLAGEIGELLNKYKKVIRDKNGILDEETRQNLFLELGDVAFYLSQGAAELNFNLEDVITANLHKLQDRQKRGKLKGSGDNR